MAASHRPIVSEDAGERAEPCQGGPNKPHAGLGKRLIIKNIGPQFRLRHIRGARVVISEAAVFSR